MEDIYSIARPVAYSSFLVLAIHDEILEALLVNPIFFLHHAESRVNPPGVAYVWKFLWPAIEASFVGLSLT